jgi:hypothetical protein
MRAAELIEDMISQHCQWTGKPAVEGFHCGQQTGMLGYPWLCGARRYGHAYAAMLLKHESGSEGSLQLRTPVIYDFKLVPGKSC